MMWWWGPCAGVSCVSCVPYQESRGTLYDQLIPMMSDRDGLTPNNGMYVSPMDDNNVHSMGEYVSSPSSITPGIYRARNTHTHDLVALKVFKKSILRKKDTRRRIRQEIRILSLCRDHPNILRLHGVYSSSKTFEIVFELANGGEVMHRMLTARQVPTTNQVHTQPQIRRPHYHFNEREISRIIAGAVCAVQYLHARGIIHGEVRPEHLLYSDMEPDARIILCDFGRATAWESFTFLSRVHKGQYLWHDRHSVKFLPPFVLQNPDKFEVDHSLCDWVHAQQLDVWSIGVTMYVLLCAKFPFDNNEATLSFPYGGTMISRAAKDLLSHLLVKDPLRSMSIDQVAAHPWIQSDVAANVEWADTKVEEHVMFALFYMKEVEISSRRKRKMRSQSVFTIFQESGQVAQARLERADIDLPLVRRDQAKYSPEHFEVDEEELDEEQQEETEVEERPSFVSIGGGGTGGLADAMSADGYMRLASAEMDAVVQVKESPRVSHYDVGIDHPTPSAVSDFWPLFRKQSHIVSFKNRNFLTSNKKAN